MGLNLLTCVNKHQLVGKLNRPHDYRAAILQRCIKWIENYYHGADINDLRQLRQELTELLEEDAKADELRSLSLSRSYLRE
jgi:hypothetical protein